MQRITYVQQQQRFLAGTIRPIANQHLETSTQPPSGRDHLPTAAAEDVGWIAIAADDERVVENMENAERVDLNQIDFATDLDQVEFATNFDWTETATVESAVVSNCVDRSEASDDVHLNHLVDIMVHSQDIDSRDASDHLPNPGMVVEEHRPNLPEF